MWFHESFFAHVEYILIAMLGDDDEETPNMSVTKVLALDKQIAEENEESKSAQTHRRVVQFACFMFKFQTWKQQNIRS